MNHQPEAKNSRPALTPLHGFTLIEKNAVRYLSPEEISISVVGEKAYGLSCLPKSWTLPFLVISSKLLQEYRSASGETRLTLTENWVTTAKAVCLDIGIKEYDSIILRSSACSEGLEERGRFHSQEGTLENLYETFVSLLDKLTSDPEIDTFQIPLVLQKCISDFAAKGHLSNERRLYEESRDWMGQFEEVKSRLGLPYRITLESQQLFRINLRNWREKVPITDALGSVLECHLTVKVQDVLKFPAAWATNHGVRVHFEWVWDGKHIYLVQADQEFQTQGVDPREIHCTFGKSRHEFKPRCLQPITTAHAKKYEKIHNVFTYFDLELPIADLYVLDDQDLLADLALGKIDPSLEADLADLVKDSLVIRVDIDSPDQLKRQFLPRTNEVRNLETAIIWLIENMREIRSKCTEDVIFIFHNFIPAAASAFVLAAPSERNVQIEALWGLPEGLYYNAHDKYVVDTNASNINAITALDVEKFEVYSKAAYKKFFVAPDNNGVWTTKVIKPPHDWKLSIPKIQWIKELAYHSRKIAEKEGKPLSIMWFVDVPESVCKKPLFPWHHEPYNPQVNARTITDRKKTSFDKSIIIKTKADVERLKAESPERTLVRRVRIQPTEDSLLRDKQTLQTIGTLTHKLGAVIVLEGAVLSHAYYQLMQTSAVVEVVYPFEPVEDKKEFNKLVRDKIPEKIQAGGEAVKKVQLSGEVLLQALRKKLLEEAIEVLDATDHDSILDEIADVTEVINAILSILGAPSEEVLERQQRKREKAGGFEKGYILLETVNPLVTTKSTESTLFDDNYDGQTELSPVIDERIILELDQAVQKWSDNRDRDGRPEKILRLNIPLTKDHWTAKMPDTIIDSGSGSSVQTTLKGKRKGSRLHLELSIHPQLQLKLLDN